MIPPTQLRARIAALLTGLKALFFFGLAVSGTDRASDMLNSVSQTDVGDARLIMVLIGVAYAITSAALASESGRGLGAALAVTLDFIQAGICLAILLTTQHDVGIVVWLVSSCLIVGFAMPSTGAAVERAAPADEPLVRAGLRNFLELGRRDVIIFTSIVLVAFGIRFLSPVYLPDITGNAHPGHVGLGYPFNPGECADITIPPAKPGPTPIVVAPGETATTSVCGMVFDEIYFPTDASKDLHQPAVDYFDPEPPLTKILMTPALNTFGVNTWSWRITTTVFGSLLAGLMYLIALRLRRDRFFATVAGALVCIDGLALVESRIGVIDIIAIFWVAFLYYTFLLHWAARTARQWRGTLYLMAASAGLAFGAKLTALAPAAVIGSLIVARYLEPALTDTKPWREARKWEWRTWVWVGVTVLVGGGWVIGLSPDRMRQVIEVSVLAMGGLEILMWQRTAFLRQFVSGLRSRRDVGPALWRQAGGKRAYLHYGVAALLVGIIFCCCWSRYLTVSHDYWVYATCDSATTGLTTDHEVKTEPPIAHIGGVAVVDPAAAVVSIYKNMNAAIVYHSLECHGHPYASHWLTWPLTYHPVLMYYEENDAGSGDKGTSVITNMGNPAIWWLGVFAMIFCCWRMLTGPMWWRLATLGLGTVSIVSMMLLFHAAEKPDTETVRVVVDGRFTVAFAGAALFGAIAGISAVVGRRFVPGFIVMGYEASWLMWVPANEQRVLFYYHALGLFLLMVLALAYMLAAIRRVPIQIGSRVHTLAPVSYALIGVIVCSFIFFYPIWTAQPLPPADHGMRLWLDAW